MTKKGMNKFVVALVENVSSSNPTSEFSVISEQSQEQSDDAAFAGIGSNPSSNSGCRRIIQLPAT